jgi:hypothetical protein
MGWHDPSYFQQTQPSYFKHPKLCLLVIVTMSSPRKRTPKIFQEFIVHATNCSKPFQSTCSQHHSDTYNYCPHCTDEKTEAPKLKSFVQGHSWQTVVLITTHKWSGSRACPQLTNLQTIPHSHFQIKLHFNEMIVTIFLSHLSFTMG